MTGLADVPLHATATAVLVDLRDADLTGVRWAVSCAASLGVGLVIRTAEDHDPVHAAIAGLLAEYPHVSVHFAHDDNPPVAWEDNLVVVSRSRIRPGDRRDVVVVDGSRTAVDGRYGAITAVIGGFGDEGVLRTAVSFCRARQATRLRVLMPRPDCISDDVAEADREALEAAADFIHASCPHVIAELVRDRSSGYEAMREHPSDLLVVSGRERRAGEGLQPIARAALHHAACPVLLSRH